MSDQTRGRPRRPWGEAVATFLTCLALGPPIGGLVFALAVAFIPAMGALADTGAGWDVEGGLLVSLFVGLFAMPFSYLTGGLQAGAAGLLFAGWGWLKGRPSFVVALGIATVVFAGSAVTGFGEDGLMLPVIAAIHIVPTLFCWLIIRTYWREGRT